MHILEHATRTFLSDIRDQRAGTNSTEELSYRDYLGGFLREATTALGMKAEFTGEAKLQRYGRPDYEVTNGLKVIGYVEAEALGTSLSHLSGAAKEQNERFRENLANFLLTNHTEFILFVEGGEMASVRLPNPPEHGAIHLPGALLEELRELLEGFLGFNPPPAANASEIAHHLARRARFLRVAADAMLSQENSPIHSFMEAYRTTLYTEISKDQFADIYAQTFTYGLFMGWLNFDKTPFDYNAAIESIPEAIPPIAMMLDLGGGRRMPEEFKWIIHGICCDLADADKEAVMRHPAGIEDPMVHFYETFLAAYDPKLRERAGVYYTPDAVVDFIVRAVDRLLIREFGKREGLADSTVRVLDPATGTATFLARAYRQVYETMQLQGDAGVWADRAKSHLIHHFYGFERLPAAYTLAHVKLRRTLAELHAPLKQNERVPVFLADTMMNKEPIQQHTPGADILSDEIRAAVKVRDQEGILVVMGNPPYFGKSDNPSKDPKGALTFIGRLIQDYYRVDGNSLGEKNPKWLQNDFVKFIRFAQWRIAKSGKGIVAFITDNSYLDNPTFRGMRQSLMNTFDEIRILNLHGNSKKKEKTPEGGKDENVFDITQGVAICILIKRDKALTPNTDGKKTQVFYAELYGTRAGKYEFLMSAEAERMDWMELAPSSSYYLLLPQESEFREEYLAFQSLESIMPIHNVGVTTARDSLTIHFDENSLWDTINKFVSLNQEDARNYFHIIADARDWKIEYAQKDLMNTKLNPANAVKILYRPFDNRWTYYTGNSRGFHCMPRGDIMKNVLGLNNISLCTDREVNGSFHHVFCSRNIVNDCALSTATRERTYLFPLWIYQGSEGLELNMDRIPNISKDFLEEIKHLTNDIATPEAVFHYIYAILHSSAYRERYAPFLKMDFPRIPPPPDAETFKELAQIGERLSSLHLLEAPDLETHGIDFPVGGDHMVKRYRREDRYVAPMPNQEERVGYVRLNEKETFQNVPPEAWEFTVGGYQPAYKWLEDRVGRALTEEEINHYRRMIAAMRETVRLLPEADRWFLGIVS